jgi:colanic acid/amylovoran biosynthesis glycosyltransferase
VSGARPVVLYLVTRFPAVTETFVVNEWLALSERFEMRLVALRRSGEAPVHAETDAVLARVRFPGVAQPSTLLANAAWLVRRPRAYISTLVAVVRDALGFSVREAATETVVFVKAAAVARAARSDGVDHVHAHFASHPATAAWVVHRLTGIPFSFTAHANDLFVAPVLLDRKGADARFAVAISEYNRRLLAERCPGARVEVVHCGVDVERYAWQGLGGRSPDRIVCVASLVAKKGHSDLIDALALLAGRRPGVVLELIGDGPERDGILRRAALVRARAFALPSVRLPSGRMEGIPVALMEAMASGVPVVATRLSGIPELVQDGVTGLLVEPNDPEGLADALDRLLADDALSAELAQAARRLVERAFNLPVEAGRLGELFAEQRRRR